jgi:hypothetical protein
MGKKSKNELHNNNNNLRALSLLASSSSGSNNNIANSDVQKLEEKPPLTFVREPSTSLICPIHKGLFIHPVIAPCGHSFCFKCIERYVEDLSHSRIPECPLDNTPIKSMDNFIPNLAVAGQINDLLVYCKYALKFNSSEERWVPDPEV